ncbi:hypothetical protein JWJ90_10750 [Desulfobulbus rhabdoformis]|uniref:hypothetical protein n=1 Tax=Desulfobulbus rhabdoformis TaxID=34032 RepID=UPI001962327E|nr:hypothetical protein [Desulfobulbus rhabdoformis]MBM9614762.1 hypothetical protein [Desulfobulbus rhabdoformis]
MSASNPAFDLNEQQVFLSKLKMITYFLWGVGELAEGITLDGPAFEAMGNVAQDMKKQFAAFVKANEALEG